ncbi:MAG: N-6 DNA methylase [Desulfamplus sp.]|nr:N-6 DNA methylase [Desulfamplus sp.]
MLDTETKKRIDTARDILVGKVPDPKSQVEQITIALVYKFMDDMDKESVEMGGQASFFSGDYERYAWSRIFDPRVGGYEMLAIYSEALVKLNQNPNIPQLFRDIFKNAYLPYRDPETLKMFLKIINEFHYDHSERLGDAFEYLLSVMSSQGDAGQFRTPRHIIDFIVDVVNPQKHESILDPACGTAGFLISSYKHIIKQNTKNGNGNKIAGNLLSTEERKQLLTNFKGYDISPDMVRLSLVNLYLHGFVQPQIMEYDTLTSQERWNEYADVILANPPFMSPKGGVSSNKKDFLKKFSVQSTRSEVLFVDYIAEHLTPFGRAGVIVPEGIIFQSGKAYKQLRKMLVENYLYAVVSLPAGIFNPYSGVKTSIFLMDRLLAKRCDSILFVKIENDGFGLGAQRREMAGSDLPDAVNVISDYVKAVRSDSLDTFKPEEKPCGALIVKKEKLAENGEYNLTGERYRVVKKKEKNKWEMVELWEKTEIKKGSSITKASVTEGEIPVIAGGQTPAYYHNEANRFGKIITVSSSGAYAGFINYFKTPIFASDCTTIQSQNEAELNTDYLFRILKNKQQDFYNFQQGMGQPHVYAKDFQDFKIPLPPLKVQQEIVSEIEGYQKLIDGARQVVDSWKPQIEINPEWDMVRLGEIISINNGYVLTEFFSNGEVACVKVSDMNLDENQYEIVTSSHWITETDKKLLPINSIVFPKRGAAIGTNKKRLTKIPCLIDNNCMGISVLDEKKLSPIYLYNFMIGFDLSSISNSAGIPLINNPDISNVLIPLPPFAIQQEIVAKIETERKAVDGCRELIKIYEEKIKRVIDRVWEE